MWMTTTASCPPTAPRNTDGAWRSSRDSWIGYSSAPHDPDIRNIQNGLLFKYDYNRSVQSYRCPADKSHVRTVAGKPLPTLRTRSYSMNGNWGGRTKEAAQLFVFIDEHEDNIDDAHFLVWPNPDDSWVNMPADRHAQSGFSLL